MNELESCSDRSISMFLCIFLGFLGFGYFAPKLYSVYSQPYVIDWAEEAQQKAEAFIALAMIYLGIGVIIALVVGILFSMLSFKLFQEKWRSSIIAIICTSFICLLIGIALIHNFY